MQQLGDRNVFSVGEVNDLAKQLLEQVSVWVEGEVYDYKPSNGRYYYIYFQLKDKSGQTILPCVIQPHFYAKLGFDLENGQKILAHGKLTLFTKSGKFQFHADSLEPAGEGQLSRQLEALKRKLQSEGLLDEDRKRPLPEFVQNVGVITSQASDAWIDFQRHSVERIPLIRLLLADVFVQGPKSAGSIVSALERMQKQNVELIVLTRGGGSLEDLSAFNDERVARAIATSAIPVLVAVGHEKDVSIADLVADVRASTPTNAGQLLTAPYERSITQLKHYGSRLAQLADYQLAVPGQQLDAAIKRLQQTRHSYSTLPLRLKALAQAMRGQADLLSVNKQAQLHLLGQSFLSRAPLLLERNKARVGAAERQLQIVSPLAVLARGYSLVEVNGKIVRSTSTVKQGDTMQVRLDKGRLKGLITRVEDD